MRRRLKRALLVLAGLVALDQVLLFTWMTGGEVGGVRLAPYDPPIFHPTQAQRLDALRAYAAGAAAAPRGLVLDAELGWCPGPDTTVGDFAYDWASARKSARPLPRDAREGTRRVVAVGCSFTRGDEVGGAECWPGLLHDADEGLDLANLGMGAYGLDQAWLRFIRDGAPLDPDEVWLVWVPGVSARLLTHYPPLEKHWSGVLAFKPRFALTTGGALELVPCPAGDAPAVVELLDDVERFAAALAGDHWIERAPAAYRRRGSSLLHRSALARLALTAFERRRPEPHELLVANDAHLLRLVRGLLERASLEARDLGVELRIIVLPSRADLAQLARGVAEWRRALAGLERATVHDLADDLLVLGFAAEDRLWEPGGHYSAEGHEHVRRLLVERAR